MTSRSLRRFLEPLYTLAKYTGLFPFDQDLELSERWWKMSFILIPGLSAKVFIIGLYATISHLETINYLSIFIQYLIQSLSVSILLSHCFSTYRSKNKLKKVGRTLATLSEGYSYKLYVPAIYTPLGILYLLPMFAVEPDFISDVFALITLTAYFTMETLIYVLNMTFCTVLEIIHQHYKDIINDIHTKSLELTTKKSLVLISICEDICEIYGLSLLFMCIRFLVIIVIMGHAMAVELHYFDYLPIDRVLKKLMVKILLILYILYTLVMVTGSCRRIQTSLNRFNVLVFREFRRRPLLVKNNVIKLYITKNPSVNFSACGFFSIENSLVTSILATGITYVVIFVQFYLPAPNL